MLLPSASCGVGVPYSGVAQQHELKMTPMCDPTSMMTSCNFASGQTVDMGGVSGQVIGQWGAGFIVAVPADKPMPNTAWVTPVHNPSGPPAEYSSVPMMGVAVGGGAASSTVHNPTPGPPAEYSSVPMMGVAVGGGAVSSTVYPNYSAPPQPTPPQPPQTMMPMQKGLPAVPAPPESPEFRAMDLLPREAKVFVHGSDGRLNAMGAKKTDGSTKGYRREKQQVPVPPPPGSEDVEGMRGKIFVHDSDGNLHHIAECSQGTGGVEVDVLEDLEEDWSTEPKPSSLPAPAPPPCTWEASAKRANNKDVKIQGKNKYHKPPSVASSNGSTTAETLPSPDQSGGESGDLTPAPGPSRTSSTDPRDWTSPACQRIRALVAGGAPSAPPPPPPIELPDVMEQVAKAGQRKTGRTKGKVAGSNENNGRLLQATEARFAPSPAPVLPSLPVALKAGSAGKSSRLARAVLTHVYRRIAGDAPVLPQRALQGRPPQTQKNEKNNRATLSRRTQSCREEPRRAALEPTDKRQQRAAPARSKHASVAGRAKAKSSCWAHQRRRVLDFLAAVRVRKNKVKKMISVHGKTFILAASVVFLIITTILCFVGESDAVRPRPHRSSMHSYTSESPYVDSSLASRRVGAVQKRLDVESARALAAVKKTTDRQETKRSKPLKSRKKKAAYAVDPYAVDQEAYAAWRESYLAKEQEYFKGLKENDPELAALLEMAGSANKYDYDDWTRMAAAYDKLMTERYGDKGISDEDSLMADRIAIMMQQQFQLADLYDQGSY